MLVVARTKKDRRDPAERALTRMKEAEIARTVRSIVRAMTDRDVHSRRKASGWDVHDKDIEAILQIRKEIARRRRGRRTPI